MSGRPSELKYVENPLLGQLEALGWTTLALDDSDKHDPDKSSRSSLAKSSLLRS